MCPMQTPVKSLFVLLTDKATLCTSNTGNDVLQKPKVTEQKMECSGIISEVRCFEFLENETLGLLVLSVYFITPM